jgi:hypothetical protein
LSVVARKRVNELNKRQRQLYATGWSATKAKDTAAASDAYLRKSPGPPQLNEAIQRRSALRENRASVQSSEGGSYEAPREHHLNGPQSSSSAAANGAAESSRSQRGERASSPDHSLSQPSHKDRVLPRPSWRQPGIRLPIAIFGAVVMAFAFALGYVVIWSKESPRHTIADLDPPPASTDELKPAPPSPAADKCASQTRNLARGFIDPSCLQPSSPSFVPGKN